jgi:DNA-binding GntR family transcriptional regulator
MENTDVVTRAEQAYRRLRSEILHGDLMPGERLRASDLQGKFQLGLTPIREALMRLSGENLVELDTHRGSRVSQTSLDELRDLMNTRRGVESLCLRSAIAHGDTAWEAAIVAALHTLSRTPLPATPADRAAAAAWEAAHRAFHLALVSACTEKWLLWFWNILADHSERYRKQRLLHLRSLPAARAAGQRDVHEEHQGLVAAILERNPDEACRRMDQHLQATEQAVAELLASSDPCETPSPRL